MSTKISTYTPEDLDAVHQLITELHDDLKVLEPDIIASGAEVATSYTDYILEKGETNRGIIYLAKKDDQAIGLVAMRVEKDKDEEIEYLFISDLIVTKNERNSGTGSKLLQRAEEYAKETGIHHLKVAALTENHGARNLYSKLGFRDYAVTLYKKLEY